MVRLNNNYGLTYDEWSLLVEKYMKYNGLTEEEAMIIASGIDKEISQHNKRIEKNKKR